MLTIWLFGYLARCAKHSHVHCHAVHAGVLLSPGPDVTSLPAATEAGPHLDTDVVTLASVCIPSNVSAVSEI